MPRPSRIEFPGALYFVSARSMPDQPLFQDNIDRRRFLEIIDAALKRYTLSLHAYVLLDDGYRLLLETPLGNLTKAMQYVNSHYTAYANTRRKRTAQVFKGRYTSSLIDKDRYLLKLVRYIHYLPTHLKLSRTPESYQWSSHQAYTRGAAQPPSVSANDALSCFGGDRDRKIRRFQEYVAAAAGINMQAMTVLLKKSRTLGNVDFEEKAVQAAQTPPVKILPDTIIDMTAEFFKVEKQSILDNKTKPNYPRNAAIFLCRNMTDTPLDCLGDMFGVGPSSVCNTAKRVDAHRRGEESLARTLGELEKSIRARA
ncbi:MAG TPA: helix-turn-helix domain-containing protein [bacterium]|nr:helix-turn-helix domain-containing protein [bacterium]